MFNIISGARPLRAEICLARPLAGHISVHPDWPVLPLSRTAIASLEAALDCISGQPLHGLP